MNDRRATRVRQSEFGGVRYLHEQVDVIAGRDQIRYRLRSQGLGVVVISHNMADVFEVCDRVVVLRLGRRVATFDVHSVSSDEVVSAITGAQFGKIRETAGAGEEVAQQ